MNINGTTKSYSSLFDSVTMIYFNKNKIKINREQNKIEIHLKLGSNVFCMYCLSCLYYYYLLLLCMYAFIFIFCFVNIVFNAFYKMNTIYVLF